LMRSIRTSSLAGLTNSFAFAVSRGLGIARALKVDADLLRN